MESLHHIEECDGEKHWLICKKPRTWESSTDFRICNNKCKVYEKCNSGKSEDRCEDETCKDSDTEVKV